MKTAWSEMFPDELEAALRARPIVYLPLGLCEPHGPGAAMGLDLLKAEALCARAAERFGGVVAPSLGYHVHEAGYHARWLEDVIGETNPRMTSIPPRILLSFFLYQLRAFNNAGFRVAFALTGHAGGNERDLRRVADAFAMRFGFRCIVRTDAELAAPRFQGDHAGRFELSQLMALRPELVDLERARRSTARHGAQQTKFAQGDDYEQASGHNGRAIVEEILRAMETLVDEALADAGHGANRRIGYEETEELWSTLVDSVWVTARPAEGQTAVSSDSQWKPYERVR